MPRTLAKSLGRMTLPLPFLKKGGLERGDARAVNDSPHLHDRVNDAGRFNASESCNS